MEGEEHDGAVGEVRDEVVVPAGCDGSVQEGGGALGGGSLHPVVVSQLTVTGRGHLSQAKAAFEL